MTLSALALDDEPQALEVIRLHAAKVPFLDLRASFTDAFAALDYLRANRVDLLFLDIKMPDISGIELLAVVPRPPLVVFTTAYSDYAVQGFELDAVDYLLKPFSLARFLKACHKALDAKGRDAGGEAVLFVKTGYEEEKIRLDDLRYVEAEGNYAAYVLENRKLLSRQTLAEVQALLPPDRFVRIHRSFIVAVDRIDKLARQEVTVGKTVIPVGASYEEALGLLRSRLLGR